MDLSAESKSTLDTYGATPGQASFVSNYLLARRLVESGVLFVQFYDRDWDHHSDTTANVKNKIKQVDQPVKQRGLLENTLVIWGGEFGRTTYGQD